jgi:hypothetical protein
MATESNTYNDYSIAATESYPLISNFSLWLKPQVGRELFDINPVESDWGDMMKMGLMKEVKGQEIFHHEANSRFDVPLVNTSTTVGDVYGVVSGGTYDGYAYVQLAAESHSPTTGPNALKYSYPRQGQHILFKNNSEWRIAYKDTTTPGAHRLYLQKVQASMPSLAATITQVGSTYGGDRFIVHTTSWEEATLGQQTGIVPTAKSYTSYLQTFTDRYTVTDFQEQDETYPLMWGKTEINFTYVKGINDTEIRMAAQIDNGLFLQNKDDGNLTNIDPITGEAVSVYTTQGYIQNLETNAPKLYYDTSPTIELYRQIGRLRRLQQQGGDVMMHTGDEYQMKAEDIVSSLGVNGSIVYDRKDVDLGIKTLRTGNMNYHTRQMRALNHPKFAGAPGFPYPYYFVISPMDKIADAKTNIPKDAFCILYQKTVGEGARGHYKIFETGANARSGAKDARMNRTIHMYAHMGMQVVGASKHILGKPVPVA